jgi:UMF1 family MFS transporter
LGSLVLLAIATAAFLSIDRTSIFFVIPVAPPVPGDGLFASTAERFYLAIGVLIGLTVGPMQASSRTLLARIAPLGKMTEYFGLYALTGKVTSFIGPLAVGALTAASGSQRVGISVVVVFFLVGAALLAGVVAKRQY